MILFLLDLTGVVVFAIRGALAAGRAGLDLLGVLVPAAVTAIGGGTLRDVLMNRHPIFWMAKPIYLIVICAAGILTVVCAGAFPPLPHVFLVADAFGLGLFAISGAQAAEDAKLSPMIVLMGMITGSAGGLIRDLLTAKIPLLLQRDIYATAAAGGIVLYLILLACRVDRVLALVAGVATVTGLRVTAVFLDWQLPVFHVS